MKRRLAGFSPLIRVYAANNIHVNVNVNVNVISWHSRTSLVLLPLLSSLVPSSGGIC